MDILVFALIAGFLVYRLRSVLGRRHGEERQRPNPLDRGDKSDRSGTAEVSNVVIMPKRGRALDHSDSTDSGIVTDSGEIRDDEPVSLAAGLANIKATDPDFDEKSFIKGARSAFKMIVMAYAEGETAVLRPLLSDDVYDSFAGEVRRRIAAGETHETKIERIRDLELIEARLDGRKAIITVKVVTDQVNVSRDASGTVLVGDPDLLVEVVDIWTFGRNMNSRDPNWTLVETRIPN